MADSFRVDVQEQNSVWILATHGYINNLGGEAIAEKFNDVLEKGGTQFLLDLADSKIINSIGVSILIEILEKTLEVKGALAFCNCAPIFQKTFKIMGITQYARIYDTIEEAVKEMSKAADLK